MFLFLLCDFVSISANDFDLESSIDFFTVYAASPE